MGVQEGSAALHGSPPLDRDRELAALQRWVARACDGQGRMVAIEGPPGLGKSTLLRAVVDQGGAAGMTVLRASASPLCYPLGYGVARQLFDALDRDGERWEALVAGAARLALPAVEALPSDPDVQAGQDLSHATLHGLYWLAANLTSTGPVLLAIDDVQWADEPSQRWLTLLGRQLEALPLLLVIAADPAEPDLLPGVLDAAAEHVRPKPLSSAATRTLVRRYWDQAARPAFCRACHAATGGNPLLLEQLLHSLADAGADPTSRGHQSIPPFDLEQVSHTVVERLSRLPPETAGLVRAAAVFGDGGALQHVAALAGLNITQAETAAETARASGILASGQPLAFVHPQVHLAVSATVPSDAWQSAHRRAAQLLATEGLPTDRIALHLLETEPRQDPLVVNTLEQAARLATIRGAPEVASIYLRRALDEPPAPDLRPAVLLTLGLSALASRRPGAPNLLRRAVEVFAAPSHRAAAALQSARALGAAGLHAEAVAACESALAIADAGDPPTRRRVEAELIANGWASVSTLDLAHHRLAAQGRRPPTATSADGLIIANRAFALTARAAPATEVLALADRALAAGVLQEHGSLLFPLLLLVLVWNDRLDQAQQICDERITAAQRQGAKAAAAAVSCLRSTIAYRRGAIREAEADARFSFTFAREDAYPWQIMWPLAFWIDALVAADEAQAAEDALAWGLGEGSSSEELPERLSSALLVQSRGRLRAAQGRQREAVADALDAGHRFERLGLRHPVAAEWRADAAEALARLGDLVPARRLADEHLELAACTGTARALGGALRVAGVVACGEQGLPLLQEAVGLLEPSEARLELVRTQIDLGSALHGTGETQAARDLLRDAMGTARRSGALVLVQRAQEALRAAGGRPRRLAASGAGALTAQELRAARMAADGLSNREIAQRLFVTLRRVERDLDGAFQKLGVKARDELAEELEMPAAASGESVPRASGR